MKLERTFFLRSALEVARDLIGKQLVRKSPQGVTSGIVVETEAYMGPIDKAAHTFSGKPTKRTIVTYGPGGFAYVYLIYGMYVCLNVVTNQKDVPQVVLLRALEPVEGLELMGKRRGKTAKKDLCSGPGKLCQAMGIGREDNGADLCGEDFFFIDTGLTPEIDVTRRINIDYAEEAIEYPWRFVWKNSEFLSVPQKKLRSR